MKKMKKKPFTEITLMRILCIAVLMAIIGMVFLPFNCSDSVYAKETSQPAASITIDQLTTNVYDLEKIKDDIFYDTATNIVYIRMMTYGMYCYVYVPYPAPDGLPYKYDPTTKTFHTITSEQEASEKKGKKL